MAGMRPKVTPTPIPTAKVKMIVSGVRRGFILVVFAMTTQAIELIASPDKTPRKPMMDDSTRNCLKILF